jgi:hypothetical protein
MKDAHTDDHPDEGEPTQRKPKADSPERHDGTRTVVAEVTAERTPPNTLPADGKPAADGDGSATKPAKKPKIGGKESETRAPSWVLRLDLLYLVVLAALVLLWVHAAWFRSFLPSPIGGISLAVPWFGALGAVLLSLTGLFDHRADWDSNYENWHIARPFVGAVVGIAGYLIFVVVVRAAAGSTFATSTAGDAVFYLVAFLVGFREAIFRKLVKQACDLLLQPGQSSSPEPSSTKAKKAKAA